VKFTGLIGVCVLSLALGCAKNRTGQMSPRAGDEIMVCGRLFHTGAPVVLWTDPGGYDAYRTERRFAPYEQSSYVATTQAAATQPALREISSPNRYGLRASILNQTEIELVRGGGWPLELLRQRVDQFVYHYDVCGTSRQCFMVLHDRRNLSVHFMLDVDGTIYQTLDLKERAWHAGTANSRSIGIEIANIGAYAIGSNDDPLDQWYRRDETGRRRIIFPVWMKDTGIRTPDFVARPARDEAVVGNIQGRPMRMYDLTPRQYESLIKLTAALCVIFPNMKCDYPRDAEGNLITRKLSEETLNKYQGLLGHYHVSAEKTDPGPAFQWDRVVDEARKQIHGE
jgi:N-acetylmuramoyl-L-alanine amidase